MSFKKHEKSQWIRPDTRQKTEREKLKFRCAIYYQSDVDSDVLQFYFLEIQMKLIRSFSPSCKQRNNSVLILYTFRFLMQL
jgi:hypothetical protein